MSAQVLELCAVRKAFGGLVAVDEVDLSVSEHELVAIVGPSGSGKSTLLRLVAGLAHVDGGEIRIGGNVVDDGVRHVDPEHRHTGLVFQEHALFPHLTVAENITFGLRGTSRAERGQRCEDWLEIVGLAGHGSRYPHELSGGERQRVALARALAPRPRLMLLDEPFASLDPNLRRRLRREIVDVLRRTRTPALFVTHDQTDALTIGDRVAVMCRGRIEQVGEPDAVFHRPINRFVAGFMGEATFLPVDPEDHCTELGPVPPDQTVDAGAELVIRPDDVAIALDPSAAGVKATVVSVEFQGPTRTYSLRLPSGTIVMCTQPHGTVLEVGSEVVATVVAGHHSLVPGVDKGP
jgi:iron(III) transport system ATP-binding protein